MKLPFRFDRDPILYNLSDAQRELVFDSPDNAPHVPGPGTIYKYLTSPYELSVTELNQFSDCPLCQQAIDIHKKSDEMEAAHKERLKTDDAYRKENAEQWEKTKKLLNLNRPAKSATKKDSVPAAKLDSDTKPQVGDVWSTHSYLPWDTESGQYGYRRVYNPPSVLLLYPVGTDEWIVAPVEPDFVVSDSFKDAFDNIKFSSKDIEGEPHLDYVAFTYFRTTMAVGQLDRPLYSSGIPDLHIRNRNVYYDTYNSDPPVWKSSAYVAHLSREPNPGTDSYAWLPEKYIDSSSRYRIEFFPDDLRNSLHGCYNLEHSNSVSTYLVDYGAAYVTHDM